MWEWTLPGWTGYLAAAVASLMFGSCYVPMKRFDTGDGLFFQWIFGATVFAFGVGCEVFSQSLVFDWYGVLGGAVWALGNVCVVPILRFLGLGLGFLVWSAVNLLGAYAWGALGLFGLEREVPRNITVSLLGLAFGVLSFLIFLFIKPTIDAPRSADADGSEDGSSNGFLDDGRATAMSASDLESVRDDLILRVKESRAGPINEDARPAGPGPAGADGDAPLVLVYGDRVLSAVPGGGRLFGLALAAWSGLCYSWNAVPYTVWHEKYLREHNDSVPGPFDYFFSFGTGVFLCASLLFVVYCAVAANRPRLYPSACLPSVLSGVMWSIGKRVAHDHCGLARPDRRLPDGCAGPHGGHNFLECGRVPRDPRPAELRTAVRFARLRRPGHSLPGCLQAGGYPLYPGQVLSGRGFFFFFL
jgi:hypothetical protein